jgi:threonine/homoserine efflux transporter RhtA
VISALIIAFFFFQLGTRQEDLRARLALLYYGISRISFNSLRYSSLHRFLLCFAVAAADCASTSTMA